MYKVRIIICVILNTVHFCTNEFLCSQYKRRKMVLWMNNRQMLYHVQLKRHMSHFIHYGLRQTQISLQSTQTCQRNLINFLTLIILNSPNIFVFYVISYLWYFICLYLFRYVSVEILLNLF